METSRSFSDRSSAYEYLHDHPDEYVEIPGINDRKEPLWSKATKKLSLVQAIDIRDSLIGVILKYPELTLQRTIMAVKAFPGMNRRDTALAFINRVLTTLRECEIVIWEHNLWQMSVRECNNMKGTEVEPCVYHHKPQLWMCLNPLFGAGKEDSEKYLEIPHAVVSYCALSTPSIADDSGKNEMYFIAFMFPEVVEKEDGKVLSAAMTPYIRTFCHAAPGQIVGDRQLPYVAAAQFMHQKVATAQRESLIKKHERILERRGKHIPVFRRVVLRRPEARPGEGHLETNREWHCRWMVRGHWRQQACGEGRKDRKAIYIAPFVKGPEDRPFKERVDYVSVNR